MADIELVIKIPEEDYAETMYRKQHSPREMDWADRVIANGTPLSEHCESCVYKPTEGEDD